MTAISKDSGMTSEMCDKNKTRLVSLIAHENSNVPS